MSRGEHLFLSIPLGSAWEERMKWNEKNIFRIFFHSFCLGVLMEEMESSFSYLRV